MNEALAAINRIKSLKEHEVNFFLPPNFCFHGPIPFNVKISNGIGTAHVLALSQDEAELKVQTYFDESASYWEEIVDEEYDEEDEDDDIEDAE
jgi:hypothetical protein